ncbi:hypothetical protein SFRURICE_002560 [Spodoptera frugiperda]|uniref:SFRICE_034851 n=1 Tax=Spodoptera frugiperda TaxID=7108 RepID=A0A2H1W6Q9_SPOFR|nr:hypothetical protein SFRURICE_002560 [Spodoptera frugiperda]
MFNERDSCKLSPPPLKLYNKHNCKHPFLPLLRQRVDRASDPRTVIHVICVSNNEKNSHNLRGHSRREPWNTITSTKVFMHNITVMRVFGGRCRECTVARAAFVLRVESCFARTRTAQASVVRPPLTRVGDWRSPPSPSPRARPFRNLSGFLADILLHGNC